jgi:hypothetical protein
VKFRYAPEGEEPQLFDLNVDDLTTDEGDRIEGAGGTQWGTVPEWYDLLQRGGWRAWRVALWLQLLRTNPDLGFEELKPKLSEVDFTFDEDEPTPDERTEGEPGKSEPSDDATDST